MISTNYILNVELQNLQEGSQLSAEKNNSMLFEDSEEAFVDCKQKSSFNMMSWRQMITGLIDIYRVRDHYDTKLLIVGVILALASGITLPILIYYWGRQMDHAVDNYLKLQGMLDISYNYCIKYLLLAVVTFFINVGVFAVWRMLSGSIAQKYRYMYLESFIKMNQHCLKISEERITNEFQKNAMNIEKAIGDRVALLYNLIGTVVTGIIVAFSVRWAMTLYMLVLSPIAIVTFSIAFKRLIQKNVEVKQFYEKGKKKLTETIKLIKQIKMLKAEAYQRDSYNKLLNQYTEKVKSHPKMLGLSIGLFNFTLYLLIGLSFYFGMQCTRGTSLCPFSAEGTLYTVGEVHIIFFEFFIYIYYWLQIVSNYKAFQDAIVSCKEINSFIELANKYSEQDPKQVSQEDYRHPITDIQLQNVTFSYPSSPEKVVLKDISIKFLEKRFNAVVGASQSGKSAISELLLKFYNASKGSITMGGKDIRSLDTSWLRARVAYVEPETAIFQGTLRENITAGKRTADDNEVLMALQQVDMYGFVMTLPQKLEQKVGCRGMELSAGQRQKIGIARALIREPQVLILDGVAAALDGREQKSVQSVLESIVKSMRMTVICSTDRAETVDKADKVWYIEGGEVKQEGMLSQMQAFDNLVELREEDYTQSKLSSKDIASSSSKIQLPKRLKKEQRFDLDLTQIILSYSDQNMSYRLGIFIAIVNGLIRSAILFIIVTLYSNLIDVSQLGHYYGWCRKGYPKGCEDYLDTYSQSTDKYVTWVIGISCLSFIAYYIQSYQMTKIDVEITEKLRKQLFRKLILMPLSYFQSGENNAEKIAERFGTDVNEVSGLVTIYIPSLITSLMTIFGGIIMCNALILNPMTVSFYAIPFAIGFCISMLFINSNHHPSCHKNEFSNSIARKLIMHIKTVLSLNYHHQLLQSYKKSLTPQYQLLIQGAKLGCFFGFSILIIEVTLGVANYYSDVTVSLYTFRETIQYISPVVLPLWTGWLAGNSFYFISHIGKAKKTAKSIFKFLLEEKIEVKQQSRMSVSQFPIKFRERIEFRNVSFTDAQDKKRLKGINLVIEPGQKVVFAGDRESVEWALLLLQRLHRYEGEITIDGVSILEYDLAEYRRLFAEIAEEVVLFSGSVRDNILLGSSATEQELERACRTACAFEESSEALREFLAKNASKEKLSEEQKQQIAWARAILRKPRILLIDEDSSGLNFEAKGRTGEGVTVIRSTRSLEGIEDYDAIYLFDRGELVHRGSYNEVMRKRFAKPVQTRATFEQ